MNKTARSPKKKMLVLCPFPEGVAAMQRLKYEQYFDRWRDDGWEIETSCYMDHAMWEVVYKPKYFGAKISGIMRGHFRRIGDLFRISRYDLVYVLQWVTPLGTSTFERLTRKLAKRLIYDVEDNILVEQNLPVEQQPNPITRWLKGPGKARYLITNADHVITSSPFLNDYCLTMNLKKACTYISSSVDTDRFLPVNSYSNDKTVVIGWTGTYSSKIFLSALEDVFLNLAERVSFRLKVIGNFDYALEGVDLEVVQWTAEHEVRDLQSFDIGVYPLPIDDWVLGKSGLKAIQYMAFGLPCVATEVGTTPMLIKSGENGILVSSPDEWLDALEKLVKDAGLRKKLGTAARQSAVENYSLNAIGGVYDAVLHKVMEKKND